MAELKLLGSRIEMVELKSTRMIGEAADHTGSTRLLDQLALYPATPLGNCC